ncbi:Neuronal acetylcholine receptor subunit alpha-4 [Calypte anna]|uniref:Neuronal acetylcholine receptor subunit alpha-4 n=1 Tax=Calypte anna TaxID=9244 RepID=A0A091I619_CALAN|nr:Neuronal acetylcholine receptor subunit alpha-4 [Calypte anna]
MGFLVPKGNLLLLLLCASVFLAFGHVETRAHAEERLLKKLFSGYNKWSRPVANISDVVLVRFGLSIAQLIDVDEKNQMMTTNVWVKQEWHDYKLRWDPQEYENVTSIRIPSELIWRPDIVLYNKYTMKLDLSFLPPSILFPLINHQQVEKPITEKGLKICCRLVCVTAFRAAQYSSRINLKCQEFLFGMVSFWAGNYTNASSGFISGYRQKQQIFPFHTSAAPANALVALLQQSGFIFPCAQPWCGLTSAEYRGRITSLDLLATLFLIHARMPLAFLATWAHCWLMFSFLAIQTPRSLSAWLLSIHSVPSLELPMGLLWPKCRTRHLAVLKLIPLESAHLSSLSRSLCPGPPHLQFSALLPLEEMEERAVSLGASALSAQILSEPNQLMECQILPFPKGRSFPGSQQGHGLVRMLHRAARNIRKSFFVCLFCSGSSQTNGQSTGSPASQRCHLNQEQPQHKPPQCKCKCKKSQGAGTGAQGSKTKEQHLLLMSPALKLAVEGVHYIADHLRAEDADFSVKEDWKYVAMVIDRIFLWMFIIVCLLGTVGLFLPPWLAGMI